MEHARSQAILTMHRDCTGLRYVLVLLVLQYCCYHATIDEDYHEGTQHHNSTP